ncbi:uncharacterized protein LOC124419670 [Lucilia cuprina]|uniref:uncharacterized protein LOC124419670 n=1 Tax=Lucilia cuprina TaxID=7375 RepID=UPI001F05F108|nr:uncharacterized protein LOC124419670 [Lucilia cuprina]
MKLLYTALIWGLIQIFTNKTLAATNNSTNQTIIGSKKELVILYENELELLAKEFCEKAKLLSEKLIQNLKIQQANSPLIKEFKKNITEFLYNYDFYQRHQLYNYLLMKFIKSTIHYYLQDLSPTKDSQYILDLLKKLQYDKLCDEYELKFQKLIKEKFLPKFEKLQTQLLRSNSKKSRSFLNWYNNLKKCQDYKCYYKYFNKFINIITAAKKQLLDYIRQELENINIYFITTAYYISKGVIKDPLILQLSPAVRQKFTKDINDFLTQYENNQDVLQLYDLKDFFQNNISQKYYYNTEDISLSDDQLLEQIFDNQKLNEFQFTYETKFNRFLERGLYGKFQKYKTSLNRRALMREQPLFEWFEHLLSLRSYGERYKEFGNLIKLI